MAPHLHVFTSSIVKMKTPEQVPVAEIHLVARDDNTRLWIPPMGQMHFYETDILEYGAIPLAVRARNIAHILYRVLSRIFKVSNMAYPIIYADMVTQSRSILLVEDGMVLVRVPRELLPEADKLAKDASY